MTTFDRRHAIKTAAAFSAGSIFGIPLHVAAQAAKGGVLAAIARWVTAEQRPIAVYFVGVGEQLEDLQAFDARDFARALLQ